MKTNPTGKPSSRSRRRFLVMFCLGLGITLAILAVLKTAGGVMIIDRRSKTASLAMAIQTAFEAYAMDQTPSSGNDQVPIIKLLMGKNPEKRIYISLKSDRFNADGQIIDEWGTPLSLTLIDSRDLSIVSAGPDKIWHTQDDIDYSTKD